MSSSNPAKPLAGRVALVTGGGSGIGKATAIRFAEAGAKVAIAGRSMPALEKVAAACNGLPVGCDVTKENDVVAMYSAIDDAFGPVDILVANAGIPGPIMGIEELDTDAWEACIDVNITGTMLSAKHAARRMKLRKRGSIVMMSSLMGLQGYPMRTAYSATKFALIGMTEAMARELGPFGVRVNALCPGAVSGENMDRVIARRVAAEGRPAAEIIAQNYTDVAALRRWVSEEEVAEAALFYASDMSSSMTGGWAKVDAGRF